MKAVVFEQHGGPDRLISKDVPSPKFGDDSSSIIPFFFVFRSLTNTHLHDKFRIMPILREEQSLGKWGKKA